MVAVASSDRSAHYRFAGGRFVVQPATRQLFVDGVAAKLGARGLDLLLALIERRDRMVGKNELFDLVWPGLVVEDNNLAVQVSGLRKLLGPAVVATIPGRGYRFTATLDSDVDNAGGPSDDAARHGPQPGPRHSSLDDPRAASLATSDAEAPAAARGNVPQRAMPLLGRDDDLRALVAQIEARTLVTVVGAAGMGKTALAHAAALALRERWHDGVWFVELAPVASGTQLVQAVAQALHIVLPAAGSAQDHLVGVLASMSLLLVLDNCEHVIDAASALARAITASAPGVRLLATSQELLNLRAEGLFRLNPLAVPAADQDPPDPQQALQFGAVSLFAQRAQADDPRFALSSDNVQAVADICRRLDGLPLAIELAAARVRLLGVQGLRDRLGERFRLLTGGARTAMPRHQTLQAAIDWSHALLSTTEQIVLRRSSVFVGGFTLEAAQLLARDEGRDEGGDAALDEWAVLDAIGALVDKSLVVADAGEPPRYRLLETTRAYALQKLAAAGETERLIERHARVVCELFERTEEARAGEQGTLSNTQFLQQLAPELDNARTALDWAAGTRGDLQVAIALAGASAAVFAGLGLSLEARPRVLALQAQVDDTADPRRAALFWLSSCELGKAGQLPPAFTREAAERSVRLYRSLGMPRRLYQALLRKAWFLNYAGDSQAARALLPELIALEPGLPVWLRAERLHVQGFIETVQEHFEQALEVHQQQRTLLLHERGEELGLLRTEADLCHALNMLHRCDEAIALARAVVAREHAAHSSNMVIVLLRLMTAQLESRRIDDAWQTMRQAMPGWRRYGAVFFGCGWLAVLLAERGRWADAARVGAAAAGAQRRAKIEQWPSLRRARDRLRILLEGRLPAADALALELEGQALDEAGIAAVCLRDDGFGAAAESA